MECLPPHSVQWSSRVLESVFDHLVWVDFSFGGRHGAGAVAAEEVDRRSGRLIVAVGERLDICSEINSLFIPGYTMSS